MERQDLSKLSVLELNEIATRHYNRDDFELIKTILDKEMDRRRQAQREITLGCAPVGDTYIAEVVEHPERAVELILGQNNLLNELTSLPAEQQREVDWRAIQDMQAEERLRFIEEARQDVAKALED